VISFISGTIEAIYEREIIVNTGNIGYRVILPERIHDILSKVGKQVKLFVHTNFNSREGIFDFYGFEKPEELAFFKLLLTVSGVGPKSAQGLLSSVDLQTLQLAIIKGDDNYLRKLSGIGSKTSQRIILELKNKLLEKGLGTLGYSPYQGREALKEVSANAKTSEDKIKEALKFLGKGKK